MKKLFFVSILILFSSLICFSQKDNYIWYFHDKCGIKFNSDGSPPTALTDGDLGNHHGEGEATLSDNNGNVFFYTDGVAVWNRKHQKMPNGRGLKGNRTSTQAAIIVPKPNSVNLYYIFTTTALGRADGLCYSIVDMSLDGGLGDISTKNVLLHTPTTEKVTAVRHDNGLDYWIVTHDWHSDVFRTFLLTKDGVNLNPVLSKTGSVHTGNENNTTGYLKPSHDGRKIALGIHWMSKL